MRPRTTKELAKRIELEYYRRIPPWQRWRRNVSMTAAALALAWIAVAALRGDQRLYNSGPVSTRHAVFGARCGACHVREEGSRFVLTTTDRACLACHDGPMHHDAQMFTPECVSCHVEHKGHLILADLSDRHCTRCHENLKTKSGEAKFAEQVTDFGSRHPEFAVLRNGARDAAQMKLNHQVHLKPELRGPTGPVQMVCHDCHRAGTVSQPWPYGSGDPAAPPAPFARGAYMNRISYAEQCIGCHPLGFDPRVTQSVPHDRPEVIRAFLRLFYLDYAAAHPSELTPSEPDEEQGGLRRHDEDDTPPVESAERWVPTQLAVAEDLLYRTKNKGCLVCHSFEAGDDLPKVLPTGIPLYWLTHARFDHRTHRELRCDSCHQNAPKSESTGDVLLPGIETCRKCHTQSVGARATCVECHRYHDKARERDPNGPLLVEQMLNGSAQ